MKNKLLKVTCKIDRSSFNQSTTSAFYTFFCLIDLENVDKDIIDFTTELNDQTKLDWVYKKICGEREHYILTVQKEFDLDYDVPENIEFHVRTDFAPEQPTFIEEITND